MAKDVDLSSKEWTDIVFEGKNKEYGAYTLRQGSPKRHTSAVIIVLSVLAALVIFLVLAINGVFQPAEDDINAQGDMVAVDVGQAEEEADEDEMVQEIPDIPEPEPEQVQQEDETTATQALTELALVDTVEKDKEMKDMDDIKEDTRTLGNTDKEGIEDLSKQTIIETVVEKKPEPVVEKKDEGPINMAMVEQKPSFPGGDAEMMKWLGNNIVYPPVAAEEGVSGKVTVQFIVEKDGSVSNVKVVRGKHPALDAEAVRVVKKMPRWTPGRNNGAPVRVTYMLPVTFKLQ